MKSTTFNMSGKRKLWRMPSFCFEDESLGRIDKKWKREYWRQLPPEKNQVWTKSKKKKTKSKRTTSVAADWYTYKQREVETEPHSRRIQNWHHNELYCRKCDGCKYDRRSFLPQCNRKGGWPALNPSAEIPWNWNRGIRKPRRLLDLKDLQVDDQDEREGR